MYPFSESTIEQIIPPSASFSAEDMLILGLAFDMAIDRKPRADRNVIARTILDDGAHGERNVERLCAAALIAALPTPEEQRYLQSL